MRKSIYEWLWTIQDTTIRQNALKYSERAGLLLDVEESLGNAISGAFTWSDQVEGHDYWADIERKAIRGELATSDIPAPPISKPKSKSTSIGKVGHPISMAKAYKSIPKNKKLLLIKT